MRVVDAKPEQMVHEYSHTAQTFHSLHNYSFNKQSSRLNEQTRFLGHARRKTKNINARIRAANEKTVTIPEYDIKNIFTYHKPKAGQLKMHEMLREKAKELAILFGQLCPESRELSLARTKLEGSVMWANASITQSVLRELTKNESADSEPTVGACVYRPYVHVNGKVTHTSDWFRTRPEAEAYPDDDWAKKGTLDIEERAAILKGQYVYTLSDQPLHTESKPDRERTSVNGICSDLG